MSEFYELTSLSCPMLGTSEVAKAARDWVAAPDAAGTLLGFWRTEFSTLGRLLILRSFGTLDELHQERRRALLSANPFNAGRLITALEMDSYRRFPFLPPAQPGSPGDVYEFRTYRLKPGGLPLLAKIAQEPGVASVTSPYTTAGSAQMLGARAPAPPRRAAMELSTARGKPC